MENGPHMTELCELYDGLTKLLHDSERKTFRRREALANRYACVTELKFDHHVM